MKLDLEEKLEHLRDEKNNISEEFTKINHKAKVRTENGVRTTIFAFGELYLFLTLYNFIVFFFNMAGY